MTSKLLWSIRLRKFRDAETALRQSCLSRRAPTVGDAGQRSVHFSTSRCFFSLTFAHSSASGGAGLRSMIGFHCLASCAFFAVNSFCASGTSSSAKIASTGHSGTHSVQSMHSSRSEEHTSELQSPDHLVCRLLLEKKK